MQRVASVCICLPIDRQIVCQIYIGTYHWQRVVGFLNIIGCTCVCHGLTGSEEKGEMRYLWLASCWGVCAFAPSPVHSFVTTMHE